jgi:hypothetical protein
VLAEGTLLASEMGKILDKLSDGKWHELSELQAEVGVTEKQMIEIMCFLSRYEFLEVNFSRGKARIAKNVQEFLTQSPTL